MRTRSLHLLKVGVHSEVDLDHGLLPVVLAPVLARVHVTQDLALFEGRVHRLHVQAVQLHQVLLDLRLRQEGVHAERHPFLLLVSLGGAVQEHLVVHEIDLTLRLLKVCSDRGLEPLGVHVLLVFLLVLVVLHHIPHVLGLQAGLGGLELAMLGGLEVAHLARVVDVEVQLVRVEAKALHIFI